MPSVLRENQHELIELDGTGGVVFGTEDTGYLTLTRPTIGGAEIAGSDLPRPQEDGIMLGRDFRGSKTYTFEVGVLTDALSVGAVDPHQANLDYLNSLEATWVDDKWRSSPRAMAMLRSCEAGRTSRCYGRPRRWEEAVGNFTRLGYTPVMADFQLIDDRWYADVESVVEVFAPPSTSIGGLISPIISPITTTLSTTSATQFADVGGFRSTWPVVEFHGPIQRPELRIGSMAIGLSINLGIGEVVTVDPRPWQRTVLRQSDGAGFAGKLSRATPVMRKMLMRPGRYACTLHGSDASGTAFARLRWRDARARP